MSSPPLEIERERERERERESERAITYFFPKPTLWSAKIMVLVIGRKILGVRDFDTCSSLPGIDLGTSKSKYECYISGSLFQYGFYSHMFPLQ